MPLATSAACPPQARDQVEPGGVEVARIRAMVWGCSLWMNFESAGGWRARCGGSPRRIPALGDRSMILRQPPARDAEELLGEVDAALGDVALRQGSWCGTLRISSAISGGTCLMIAISARCSGSHPLPRYLKIWEAASSRGPPSAQPLLHSVHLAWATFRPPGSRTDGEATVSGSVVAVSEMRFLMAWRRGPRGLVDAFGVELGLYLGLHLLEGLPGVN